MAEKTIAQLLKVKLKERDWSKEILAGKLRDKGISCTTQSIYNWLREEGPSANASVAIRSALGAL